MAGAAPADSGAENDGGCAIPERLLARLWQKRAARQASFRTGAGRRVRVLYPGRGGQSQGPDFRNALLEIEGVGLVQGDVELHVRQEDWQRHGHATDPAYNGVALHAVLQPAAGETRLASGQTAPVISLEPLLAAPEAPGAAAPELWDLLARWSYPRPATAAALGELLDRAGDARFARKSARFAVFLAEQSPEQTLHESLLEGLGYRPNQQPFLQLATRAPWETLAQAARPIPVAQRPAVIEGWLLHLAGLLTPEEVAASRLPRAGFGRPLAASQWHLARLRPANQPRRRIAGAAGLVARFLEVGLVAGLHQAAGEGRPRALIAALTVEAPDGGPAYVGPERAADLAVNVALPLLHALAVAKGDTGEAGRCQRLYRQFAKLQDNELTRELTEQLLEPGQRPVVNSARRQQGLLHLRQLLLGGS